MKIKKRRLSIAAAAAATVLFGAFSGCAETPREPDEMALFENLFVPTAEGRVSLQPEEFMKAAAENGFDTIEEAGVILVLDPQSPDVYLRGEQGTDAIEAIVYSRETAGMERQVRAENIGTDTTVYFVGGTSFSLGDPVLTLEELREYLVSEPGPEEERAESGETALAMYENILLPLADGRLENQGAAIHAALDSWGYIYRQGEGLFTVHDPAAPENYLFGMPMLLEDGDQVATLGFHLEGDEGALEVEIFFFTESPEYYAQNSEGRVELASLEELKSFIGQ